MKVEEQLSLLVQKLKERNNPAHKFFEALLNEVLSNPDSVETRERILSCFAITQYADFTHEEEELLSDIIEKYQS